jgi:hypothetical protein
MCVTAKRNADKSNSHNKTSSVYNVTVWRFWETIFAYKAISITYPECVSVALVIHHAKRIRRILLSPVLEKIY